MKEQDLIAQDFIDNCGYTLLEAETATINLLEYELLDFLNDNLINEQ